MGPLIGLLIILGVLVLWVFFAFPPAYADQRPLKIFNWTVVAVCAMGCIALALNIETILTAGAYAKWGPMLTIAGCLGIEICVFTLFFLLRNFWIFKAKSLGSRW